jgi:hypothetical protein
VEIKTKYGSTKTYEVHLALPFNNPQSETIISLLIHQQWFPDFQGKIYCKVVGEKKPYVAV